MGDPPNSGTPLYDPYDSPINYDYFALMSDPNPTLSNIPSPSFNPFGDPFSHTPPPPPPPPVPVPVPVPPNNNNLFQNDVIMVWDHNYNRPNANININVNTTTQQAGPSRPYTGTEEPPDSSSQRRPQFIDDARPLLVWPPDAVPYQCSFCQVLREIIHTDGVGRCATKLEIHGRLGIICHAILEIKDLVNLIPSSSQFHMIDFCKKSIDNVKEYLQQYCNDQKRVGLVMVQDPLSTFYEALCVGIPWHENVNNEDPFFQENEEEEEEEEEEEREMRVVAQAEGERMPRTNLAQQRERAGRLTIRDFEEYFHLPIEEAARQMNLCPTVVKKICRRDGMPRWPYRKIKSLQRQISNFRLILSTSIDTEERARAEAEIQRLETEIAIICAGGNNNDDTTE